MDREVSLLAVTGAEEKRVAEDLAALAAEFFKKPDDVFNLGGHGIFVILPDLDLDEGTKQTRHFSGHVMEQLGLAGSFDMSNVRMGVAARQKRTVSAARLAREALSAAGKAAAAGPEDDSRVVAFRVDPARWAAFSASHEV